MVAAKGVGHISHPFFSRGSMEKTVASSTPAKVAFLFAVVACLSGCWANDPSSVAFVVYDAGETLGLLPVAGLLEERDIEVRWMPLTPWAADLLTANGQDFLTLPARIEEMAHLEARDAATDMAYWVEALAKDPPRLAVSGLVSTAQAQLGEWFSSAGIPTRGFHDGFQPPRPGSMAVRTASAFQELWVPTARVRDAFLAMEIPAILAGQPTLEAWRRTSREVEVETVRQRLGVEPGQRMLLFAGQYGPGYEEVLASFLGGMGLALAEDPSLILVVSHHPRTDGSAEARALDGAGLPRAAMAPDGMSTMELATAAEVLLTWTSTVGVQAAFMGRPVIYFSPPAEFDAHLVEEGIALRAEEGTLASVLAKVLRDQAEPEAMREALVRAGYVVSADSVVADLIQMAVRP
jgi:hypothetical protein